MSYINDLIIPVAIVKFDRDISMVLQITIDIGTLLHDIFNHLYARHADMVIS